MNPDMGLGFFQTLLQALQGAFIPGIAIMQPLVMLLSALFILLELVRVGAQFALGMGRPWELISWIILLAVRTYVIADWQRLMTMMAEAFVHLGLVAGGNAITQAQFLDPGAYLQIGLQTAEVLYANYTARAAIAGFFNAGAIVDAVLYIGAWLLMVIAYAYMALQIFMIQMEMTLAVVIGYPFLAFMHSRHTAWIARGAIAYPINQGVAFLTLAFLSAVLFRFLQTPQVTNPGIKGSALMVFGAGLMALLFVRARKVASGIITGQPTLTAGSLVAGLVAGVGATMLGAGAAVAGTRMALTGVSRVSQGVQAGSAAYHAGGVGGVVIAGGNAVRGGFHQVTAPLRQAIAGNYQRSTQQGRGGYGGFARTTATRSMLSFIDDDASRGLHY